MRLARGLRGALGVALTWAALGVLVGLLSGLGFAALLSLGRVALWGLLGSAAAPLLMGADTSMGWLTGALGALFAAGSLAGRGTPVDTERA